MRGLYISSYGVAVFIDDWLGIKEMCKLFLCHTLSCIGYGYLNIVRCLRGREFYPSLSGSKFPRIIRKGVKHEEREHPVGLHLSSGVFDIEGDTLHLKTLTTLGHNVKERLKGKTFHLYIQLSLT